jgi:uracil-DNA glycosylase family 4
MATLKARAKELALLDRQIVACRSCPRLVAWREEVARTKRRAFASQTYWGRPLPGFGDPDARIVVLGLAPGAHGANRTGRVFTGDRSGEFLYAALHRAGLANQPTSVSRDDGLVLRDVFITLPVRCVPPGNRPTPDELDRCSGFLDRELALLPRVRVVVALGAIAWDAYLEHVARAGGSVPKPRPPFAHGTEVALAGTATLLGSYHVSQQNTQTGRLTSVMFDTVLRRAISVSTMISVSRPR